MSDNLTPLPGRDASDSIKGFVYQVDLTIERWLQLGDDEILELEWGEDIDQISPIIEDGTAGWQRRVEQVKARSKPLTLRSDGAVAAVANAVAYRNQHGTSKLMFRYTTDVSITTEKPPRIATKVPAIHAWEQMRRGECPTAVQPEYLAGIQSILQSVPKPDGVSPQVWDVFKVFLGETERDPEKLVDLIRAFEWSTQTTGPYQMGDAIRQALLDGGYAANEIEADDKYRRLFVYIFKLLCRRAGKRLTIEDRRALLTQPSLSADDRAILDRVMDEVRHIEERVTQLEMGQGQVLSLLHALGLDPPHQLAQAQSISATFTYAVTPPSLDVPPLPTRFTPRQEAVRSLLATIDSHTWTAMVGGDGTGKTYLAVLLAGSVDKDTPWIRFREGGTVAEACNQLDQASAALAGQLPRSDLYGHYSQICKVLGKGAAIVIDNLPRMQPEDELAQRLLFLVQACRVFEVRLLSTSPHVLPRALRESLAASILSEMDIPKMDESDVTALLDAYGATQSVNRSQMSRLIGQITAFDPVLIVAAVAYLAERGWSVTRESMEALFAGEHIHEINEETTHRLIGSIDDSEARDLLYRLSLTPRPFSMEDVVALAELPPAVDRPRERLDCLIGRWVQHESGKRMLVSPRVRALHGVDVPAETRKRCHSVLADRIIEGRTLDQYDGMIAISHYRQAEEYNKAALVLISGLNYPLEIGENTPAEGLLALWAEEPLPDQIDINLRLYIRALQLAVRHRRGMRFSYLSQDLDNLLRDNPDYADWATLAIAIYAPTHANRYLIQALRKLPTMKGPTGKPLTIPEGTPLEWLIWWHTDLITGADQLREWMEIVDQMTPEERGRAFSGRLGEAGCMRLSQQLWLHEARKSNEEWEWSSVLTNLDELASWALALGEHLLWACAVRVRIIILAEDCKDLAAAEAVARAALAGAPNDPRIHFLLHSCLGRQYLVAKRDAEAKEELDKTLAQHLDSYPFLRMDAFLDASRAAGDQNAQAAIDYAARAVDIAETNDDIPRIELVRALGELAIAQWLATGNLTEVYDTWDQAGRELLGQRAVNITMGPRDSTAKRSIQEISDAASLVIEGTQSNNGMTVQEIMLALDDSVFALLQRRGSVDATPEDQAIQQLVVRDAKAEAWQDVFIMYGHVSGFFHIPCHNWTSTFSYPKR